MRTLLWLLLVIPFACTPTPPKAPTPQLGKTIPTWNTVQSMEGRVGFEETLFVLHRGTKTIRSFEASVSGIRKQALFKGHHYVNDRFTQVQLISRQEMPHILKVLSGLSVYTPLEKTPTGVLVKSSAAPHRVTGLLPSLYAFSHTLPRSPKGHPLPLRKGLTWNTKTTLKRNIKGRTVTVFRTTNYRVIKLTHQGELHQATIQGTFTASSKRALKLGPFTVEIIGRGVFEAEFSLDRGVWTHIQAKEILGWAGTYHSAPGTAPLTTGYKQQIHMDLYFTENR